MRPKIAFQAMYRQLFRLVMDNPDGITADQVRLTAAMEKVPGSEDEKSRWSREVGLPLYVEAIK